jgi:hypothetical protein
MSGAAPLAPRFPRARSVSRYPEYDPHTLRDQPYAERESKVRLAQLARPPRSGATVAEMLAGLPEVLAGAELRLVVARIAAARRGGRAVVAACGGHVVKCGLGPVLIRLMEEGVLTALALNGAVAIHDAELALFGATSEDVLRGLQTGTFGVARETAAFYNGAIRRAQQEGLGAGEALGLALREAGAPHARHSLVAEAYRLGVPVTVHIALGTDIVHMHPGADGAALGEASLRDFRILTAAMRGLAPGGVLLNIGSAVVLPEVLLKAIALLRNESLSFTGFLGVNLDFLQQYRSNQQVVSRVRALGGEGVALTGHHEIMLPLLAHAVLDALATPAAGDPAAWSAPEP